MNINETSCIIYIVLMSYKENGWPSNQLPGSLLWDQLPVQVWKPDSLFTLKIRLKTLFEKARGEHCCSHSHYSSQSIYIYNRVVLFSGYIFAVL